MTYALNNDFRFLSYGDVNLLWNKKINGDSSTEFNSKAASFT